MVYSSLLHSFIVVTTMQKEELLDYMRSTKGFSCKTYTLLITEELF